jgi:phospholipase C
VNPPQKPDDPIKHVILLMFENHAFDQMLGCFKAVYADLEGVDPQQPRSTRDDKGNNFLQSPKKERQMVIDPHQEVEHVATQMKDHNQGFVKDFVAANKDKPADVLHTQCGFVMGYYPLDFLPALHRLAREFLICDDGPSQCRSGPTWPNRHVAG